MDKYNQNGGVLTAAAIIGQILIAIGKYIVDKLIELFYFLFGASISEYYIPYLKPGEGNFYKFVWLAIRAGVVLVIFAFGGPLITLIAVFFMYKTLFAKFSEMRREDNPIDSVINQTKNQG